MNRLKLITILLLIVGWKSIYAQNGAVTGFCVKGATQALTSGSPSSNTLEGIVPGGPAGCLVQVYITGTVTPAVIHPSLSGGTLANPFRAAVSGQWLFYAPLSAKYDVVLSSGVPPNAYTTPMTLTGLGAGTGGGGGGCTGSLADVTSTDCGTGNQTGNTGTHISTFGYQNVDGANTSNHVDAFGTGNAQKSDLTDLVSFGDANAVASGTGTITGFDTVFIGDSNGNLSNNVSASFKDVVGVGDGNFEISGNPASVDFRDAAFLGDSNGTGVTFGRELVGGGISACSANSPTAAVSLQNVVCFGNGAVSTNPLATGAMDLQDVIGIGDGAAAQITGTGHDIIGIGDGAGSDYITGTHDIIGIGNGSGAGYRTGAPGLTTITDLIGIGDHSGWKHGTGSSMLGGIGYHAANQTGSPGVDTNSTDIYAYGDTVCDDLGASSSDVFCFGHNINSVAPGTTLTNAIGIGANVLLASNSIVIGNNSMTSLTIFGTGDGCLSSASGVVTGGSCGGSVQIAAPNASIPAGHCWGSAEDTFATISASGVTTTSGFGTSFMDGTAITIPGWGGTGAFVIYAYPTADHINWQVCNESSGALNPTGATLNFSWGGGGGGGGSSGFPITLGSTSIAASSTTTAVTGLAVNGVTLTTGGSSSNFLNAAGSYTTPAGSGTITASPQFQIPYYSLSGTHSTITGDPDSTTDGAGNVTYSTVTTVGGTNPSQVKLTYNSGHPLVPGSATSAVYGVDASGFAVGSEAGGAASRFCTAANGICASGTGISGATTGQALIAGSSTTATSSKALAGSGAGLTTGPTSASVNKLPFFTGSSGQIADSGVDFTTLQSTGEETVTFSATPTFSNALLLSKISLTGNITSSTLANGFGGQIKCLLFIQDATGGRTVVPPASVTGFVAPTTTANAVSQQCFVYETASAAWNAVSSSAGGGGNTTSTSLTTNTLPKANGANSIIDSKLSDNGTTLTYAAGGTSNGIDLPSSSAPITPVSGHGIYETDASGNTVVSENGATASRVCTAGNGICTGTGAYVNITGAVTVTGCTVSSGQCVAGSPVAALIFSSIPGTYINLRMTCSYNTTNTAAGGAWMQFNGDTGANYVSQLMYGVSTTTGAVGPGSATATATFLTYPGTPGGASGAIADILIPNYAGTTWNKMAQASTSRFNTGSLAVIQNATLLWNSTAAITSIKIAETGWNITAGSTCSLYGIL